MKIRAAACPGVGAPAVRGLAVSLNAAGRWENRAEGRIRSGVNTQRCVQDSMCEIFSSLQGPLHSKRKHDSEALSAEPSGLFFFLMRSYVSGRLGPTDLGAGPGAGSFATEHLPGSVSS